jgi:hypothetical protein
MYLTGARVAPPSKKKIFTERNLYLLLHNFVHKVFSYTFLPSYFMHNASHMDWDFFYRQGWGGVLPYQGVELRQHL